MDKAHHPVMAAAGSWADRTDLDDLLHEIYATRESSERGV